MSGGRGRFLASLRSHYQNVMNIIKIPAGGCRVSQAAGGELAGYTVLGGPVYKSNNNDNSNLNNHTNNDNNTTINISNNINSIITYQ